MRLLIVGGGIMGLATAWAAVRRGHDAVVLEQGAVPNPLGGSVDHHRIIRHAYGEAAGYARMVDDAYAAWERLWRDLDATLWAELGVLALLRGPDGWGARSAAVLDDLGIAAEQLGRAELAARWPLLALDDGIAGGHYAARGGILFAERIVAALAGWLGSRVRSGAAVLAIDADRGEARLADGSTVAGDRLVVAAGPWLPALLPAYAGRIVPSRQAVAYLAPPDDLLAAWRRMPVVLDIDASEGLYMIPPVGDLPLKLGDHRFSRTGAPDEERAATSGDTAPLLAAAARRLADFEQFRFVEARTCFYDVVDDERFVIEPLGSRGLVMTGFSGHGFKFGALLGERVVAALEEGPAAAQALARYAAGAA